MVSDVHPCTALILFGLMGLGAGCAAQDQIVRAHILEHSDGDPNHAPYSQSHRREVTLVGAEARTLAARFPELGSRTSAPANHAGLPRFDISLMRASGAELRAEVLTSERTWFEAGNYYELQPGTIDLLNRVIKNAEDNPLVEADIVEYKDEAGKWYQAPKRDVIVDRLELDRFATLFPQLDDSSGTSEAEIDPSILVVLRYANGNRTYVQVNKEKWQYSDRSGVRRLHSATGVYETLKERMATVGNTAEPPASQDVSAQSAAIRERMRVRREAEGSQPTTRPQVP